MPPPAGGGAVAAAAAATEAVKVVVRCRPLSEREVQDGRQQIVDADAQSGTITVRLWLFSSCLCACVHARCRSALGAVAF